MFIYNYENVLPAKLDDETNTYSTKYHMPIVSLDYIFDVTGVDMRVGVGENEVDAVLLYIEKFTMNTLKALIPFPSRNMLEFMIAKDENYRKGFVDTVCAVVSTTRGRGLTDFLSTGVYTLADLPKIVQVTAEANNLLIQFYTDTLPSTWIRSDY